MRRARTRRRAGAVASGVLLLGGCGIQESDVIEAGGPASVQAFVGDQDMLLFFQSPGGGLSPVVRSAGTTVIYDAGDGKPGVVDPDAGGAGSGWGSGSGDVQVPTEKVVLALLAGPDQEDRHAGLRTSLPAAPTAGKVQVTAPSDGQVTIDLPIALDGLRRTAVRQLVCTIAYSQDSDGRVTVRLRGKDGASESGTCDLDPALRRRH
ncbi:hypothetical protein [Streptomyces sp. NPDC093094]|uniref:hypothetical protein n=1 Tax=Streptomyces sp. NPDC093094 TaxID=3366026 RepID=UPI003826F3FD